MTHSIKQLFHISASKEKVFKAITSINGLSNWWTTEVSGEEKTGGILKFRFANMGGPDMKVIKLQSTSLVSWECVESNHGWVGHTFTFALDDNDGKTRVRFSHDGWEEINDLYAAVTFSWARYLESLRQYCQTGNGEGFGTPGYRK